MLVGDDWKDLFDVVIVQARKPRFFTDESRPIRMYDENKNVYLWDRVTKLERGKIYYEVSVNAGSTRIQFKTSSKSGSTPPSFQTMNRIRGRIKLSVISSAF